jgi:hypothetical protein
MPNVLRRQNERLPRVTLIACSCCLGLGLAVGVLSSAGSVRAVWAGGGDRPDSAIVATAAISTEHDPKLQIQVATDGVYYLNYSKGRLLAAVPQPRMTASATQILSEFAETDLVRDFQLAPGTNPHFVMTPGTTGPGDGRGAAMLYVFETTTGQLAIYKLEPRAVANSTVPVLQLLERKRDPRLAHAGSGAAPASAPGR